MRRGTQFDVDPWRILAAGIAALATLVMLVGGVEAGNPVSPGPPLTVAPESEERDYLVPELRDKPYSIQSGPRPFLNRFVFSPAYGSLGEERYYAIRFAYHPSSWLGWEANIGHSPGGRTHALLNTLAAVARYPLPGRVQPYVSGGYGMIMVFPGEALRADEVTKNLFVYGGGIEAYIRDDVALRFDLRGTTVLNADADGTVSWDYREATIGFAFYREIL